MRLLIGGQGGNVEHDHNHEDFVNGVDEDCDDCEKNNSSDDNNDDVDDDYDDYDDNDDLCDRERSKPEWQHLDHRPSFRPIALISCIQCIALHPVHCIQCIALHSVHCIQCIALH